MTSYANHLNKLSRINIVFICLQIPISYQSIDGLILLIPFCVCFMLLFVVCCFAEELKRMCRMPSQLPHNQTERRRQRRRCGRRPYDLSGHARRSVWLWGSWLGMRHILFSSSAKQHTTKSSIKHTQNGINNIKPRDSILNSGSSNKTHKVH
jgi:hypothetical protein